MTITPRQRTGIALTLAVLMAATRINHFAAIPDASWAVFFLGGFYVGSAALFAAFMTLAVIVDYVVITQSGLSFWNHYCVSAAYWFLPVAYGAMWMAGRWLQKQAVSLNPRGVAMALASALVGTSVCFVISNGSFYWLTDSISSRDFSGWLANLADWYAPYLTTTTIWLSIATLVHLVLAQIGAKASSAAAAPSRR